MQPLYSPHRTVAVLAVAVLLLLAGCTGTGSIPGADGGTEAPEPYTERGAALNGTDLATSHADGLREAGSYRASTDIVVRSAEGTARMNGTIAADVATNRSRSSSRIEGGAAAIEGLVVETYSQGNETYWRLEADSSQGTMVRYGTGTSLGMSNPLAMSSPVGAGSTSREGTGGGGLIAATVDRANWTMVGVERYGDGWVTRYEASGPEDFSGANASGLAPAGEAGSDDDTAGDDGGDAGTDASADTDAEVSSANATLLVDADGVVRRLALDVEGTSDGAPVGVSLEVAVDGMGSTTVEPPEWLDDAKEAGGTDWGSGTRG